MEFIANIPSYHNKLLATAWQMVDEETTCIDGTMIDADNDDERMYAEHRKACVAITYSRGWTFVRAQLGEDNGQGQIARDRSDAS